MRIINQIKLHLAVIAMILFLTPVSYLNASSVLEVSMDELVQKSQLVFEGTVTGIESKAITVKRIYTYVTFKITEIVKGEYSGNVITLRFLGGTVGENTLSVSDMRIPQVGERGIYFVESLDRFQINPLYGWDQGHYILKRDSSGTERVMTNKRLPVTGVFENRKSEKNVSDKENTQALSNGIAANVMVDKEINVDKGMTADDFKTILRQRRGKTK